MMNNTAMELNMDELAAVNGCGFISDVFGFFGAKNVGDKIEKTGSQIIDNVGDKVKTGFYTCVNTAIKYGMEIKNEIDKSDRETEQLRREAPELFRSRNIYNQF